MHAGVADRSLFPMSTVALAVVNQWEMSQRELLMWESVRRWEGVFVSIEPRMDTVDFVGRKETSQS